MARLTKHFVTACWSVTFLMSAQSTVGQSTASLTVEQILAENPDPFIDIDSSAVFNNYGPQGSGIALALGGVPLVLTGNSLVSNTETISGATGIVADPSGFGFIIGLSGDYLFPFDKSLLTGQAKEALTGVLDLYQKYDGTSITVEGHTDSKGGDAYNQKLSERRADAVVLWFTENGVLMENLTSVGFGETQPVAQNSIDEQDNPDGRALNRRVEIRVVTNKRVNSLPTASNPTAKN